jgi:addiction module RelE/StbE family toxin
MQITWHRRARHDPQAVREYIAEINPGAARQVAQRILQAVGLLAEQPSLGRPGRVPETRELVITGTPYIAAYRVVDDTIVILRVLHGAHQWPERL